MPLNTNTANRFTNSFMEGFSFIDSINQRNLAQDKLDKRLEAENADRAFRRGRLEDADAIAAEDRATRLDDRARARKAQALLADPNTSNEELQAFADIPAVANRINENITFDQDRADSELIVGQNAQQGVPSVTQPQGNGGLSDQVTAAQLPPDEFAAPGGQETATARDLNDIADVDPQEAMRIRDAQTDSDPRGLFNTEVPAFRKERLEKERANATKKGQINADWQLFLDIENTSGDALRNTPPGTLTAKWFDDRSNITDPDVRNRIDTRMRPVIAETIAVQQEAFTAATTPQEIRNSSRKLSEAYGLANEIKLSYSPLAVAGVDARGYPVGTTNQQLADGVEESVRGGPGTQLPPNPDTSRADVRMINRGTSGKRVNERLAVAAFRQYKNGRINWVQYKSILDTGHLPVAGPVIEQTNPAFDTWATFPAVNGAPARRVLIQPGRDIKNDNRSGRNTLDDDALTHLKSISSAYNTTDDPVRGTRLINTFMGVLSANEQKATTAGYDLSNILDVQALFQRFNEIYVVRDAYDDEWSHNGNAFPDFTKDFGTIDEALFNRNLDNLDRKSIANFFFGEAAPLKPLKDRDPAIYENIRQQAPEFAQSSDEEIEEALLSQGL